MPETTDRLGEEHRRHREEFMRLRTRFADLAATSIATTDPRIPTLAEKAALAGTAGAPSAANKYVTDQDTRLVAGATTIYDVLRFTAILV